jgi:hypothetical protein
MAGGKFNPKMIAEGIIGAAVVGFTILFSFLLRPWYRKWGATEEEYKRPLPGDEYVLHPKSVLTLAITINTPASQIWPWYVQLGCQRGGWYSYDLLDNGGVPSADRIIQEYQHLQVGDTVKAVPNGSFGFPVAQIEPNQALVLAGTMNTKTRTPADPNDPNLEAYFSGDQTFYLDELDNNTTRLMFRMRTDWNPSWFNTLIYRGVVEPISFVMGMKMLLNIKKRSGTPTNSIPSRIRRQ